MADAISRFPGLGRFCSVCQAIPAHGCCKLPGCPHVRAEGVCVMDAQNRIPADNPENRMDEAMAADEERWAEMCARLLAVERERDAAQEERDEAARGRKFSEEWYAVRWERLTQLAKEKGFWPEAAAIMANGTASGDEPATYTQQLMRAKFTAQQAEARAKQAERERDEARQALTPFSEAADCLDDDESDESSLWEAPESAMLTAGDLRMARYAKRALLANVREEIRDEVRYALELAGATVTAPGTLTPAMLVSPKARGEA